MKVVLRLAIVDYEVRSQSFYAELVKIFISPFNRLVGNILFEGQQ